MHCRVEMVQLGAQRTHLLRAYLRKKWCIWMLSSITSSIWPSRSACKQAEEKAVQGRCQVSQGQYGGVFVHHLLYMAVPQRLLLEGRGIGGLAAAASRLPATALLPFRRLRYAAHGLHSRAHTIIKTGTKACL